jgi:hypothetical protein
MLRMQHVHNCLIIHYRAANNPAAEESAARALADAAIDASDKLRAVAGLGVVVAGAPGAAEAEADGPAAEYMQAMLPLKASKSWLCVMDIQPNGAGTTCSWVYCDTRNEPLAWTAS